MDKVTNEQKYKKPRRQNKEQKRQTDKWTKKDN